MVISHGEVVWVDFGSPRGTEPVGRVPSYTLAKIGDGIRLILGI